MPYLGDFIVGQSVYKAFTTVQSTGAPSALSTGTVVVYKDDGTSESSAGVTLSTDFDGRTGLNLVKVDTSADGAFYNAGHEFEIVLSAGIVNSVQIGGYEIGHFSIANRTPKDSAGVTTMLADYARRTGDYATTVALAALQGDVTTILADYARRTGDYATVAALATLQGNVTTILADYARRTGDYSTLTALQVWTYVTRTLTASGAITPADIADIWAYASRTLTQSGVNVQAAVAGSELTITRGNTIGLAITGLGALTNYVSLFFTVKHSYDDPDSAALIQIKKNLSGVGDGLMYINGVVGTPANGSLTLNSIPLGNITVNLTAAECAKLTPDPNLVYDIKIIQSAGILQYTMRKGKFILDSDVTMAII